jgi:RNA polymerase sigma-70 factor (ECF subfamily)
MSFDDDAKIARKVQKGNKEAFEALVEKYQRPIFSFIYNFFRDFSACEDLTQETFLRAYRFINTYNVKKKFSTWLFAIAKNLCIDEKRRKDKTQTLPIENVPEVKVVDHSRGKDDPEEVVMNLDVKDQVKNLIDRLPDKYKTAVILFYFNELSYEEISNVMGTSMANTKIILFRAKKMLSTMYRDEQNE